MGGGRAERPPILPPICPPFCPPSWPPFRPPRPGPCAAPRSAPHLGPRSAPCLVPPVAPLMAALALCTMHIRTSLYVFAVRYLKNYTKVECFGISVQCRVVWATHHHLHTPPCGSTTKSLVLFEAVSLGFASGPPGTTPCTAEFTCRCCSGQ